MHTAHAALRTACLSVVVSVAAWGCGSTETVDYGPQISALQERLQAVEGKAGANADGLEKTNARFEDVSEQTGELQKSLKGIDLPQVVKDAGTALDRSLQNKNDIADLQDVKQSLANLERLFMDFYSKLQQQFQDIGKAFQEQVQALDDESQSRTAAPAADT